MKYTNNGEGGVQISHLLSTKQASSPRTGLYPVELLASRVSWKPPNKLGHCQDNSLIPAN